MKNQNIKYVIIAVCMICSFVSSSGCKKMIEVDPPVTSQNGANIFNDDATAVAVLTGQYIDLADAGSNPLFEVTLNTGLMSDELVPAGNAAPPLIPIYKNAYTPLNIEWFPWNRFYNLLFTANSTIEGLNNTNLLTPSVKKQLLGEQYFLRAFYYFYLTSLYGDVPLAITSDYKVNAALNRSSQTLVYEQIISDLLIARANLSVDFVGLNLISKSDERVRPTKWAAEALLSRTYLYAGMPQQAEEMASNVIEQKTRFDLTSLSTVFSRNNTEAIWQLQPTNSPQFTLDAIKFVYPVTGPDGDRTIYVNSALLNGFETGDLRKSTWMKSFTNTMVTPSVTYYYPYKYKSAFTGDPQNEYYTVFRLAEQYLIRAEARVKNGKLTDAKDDLNVIRNRAGLGGYTDVLNTTSLLNAIMRERRVELFCEYGHRWFDLKRSGTINSVMLEASAAKGGNWDPYKAFFPISNDELQRGVNLKQTPGY